MTNKKFPARIHILIARDSNQAIIIRRGPSNFTCVLGWNRKKNTYHVSQWLKGRIFERRSDISPSGTHWIYFAAKAKYGIDSINTWTAVARSPWLKAISMFPKEDSWYGGGLFLNDKTYWLNDGNSCFQHEVMHETSELNREDKYEPNGKYGGECLHVYYNRLQRDDWVLEETSRTESDKCTTFKKVLSYKWILKKICHAQTDSPEGKGCYWDEHVLINRKDEMIHYPNWEWAEWVDNVVYFSEKGNLYKISVENSKQLSPPKLLHNFNNYIYEKKQAPY